MFNNLKNFIKNQFSYDIWHFFISNYQSLKFFVFKKYSARGHIDKSLIKILNKKKNGFYLEVGAYNGIFESISLRLEKDLDWSGLLIEPNPLHYKYLKRNRSKNICLNRICLSKEYLNKKLFIKNWWKNRQSDFEWWVILNVDNKRDKVAEKERNKNATSQELVDKRSWSGISPYLNRLDKIADSALSVGSLYRIAETNYPPQTRGRKQVVQVFKKVIELCQGYEVGGFKEDLDQLQANKYKAKKKPRIDDKLEKIINEKIFSSSEKNEHLPSHNKLPLNSPEEIVFRSSLSS